MTYNEQKQQFILLQSSHDIQMSPDLQWGYPISQKYQVKNAFNRLTQPALDLFRHTITERSPLSRGAYVHPKIHRSKT